MWCVNLSLLSYNPHIPNIDAISGALIILSLSILILNSKCAEGARDGIDIWCMGIIAAFPISGFFSKLNGCREKKTLKPSFWPISDANHHIYNLDKLLLVFSWPLLLACWFRKFYIHGNLRRCKNLKGSISKGESFFRSNEMRPGRPYFDISVI